MITLELTQEEVNVILMALAEKPYGQVFQLICKIQRQGNEQIQQQKKEDFIE